MSGHPRIVDVVDAPPEHEVAQATARAFAARHFGPHLADVERLLPVFDNAGIERRRVAAPIGWFTEGHGFGARNDRFLGEALRLGTLASRELLERHGLAPAEVDVVVAVTSSGLATPTLDARLCGTLGLRGDVARLPVFGLGCAGGALGLVNAAALLAARPSARLLLVNVELCALTFQPDDFSKSNLVATALFADGVTATLLVGADCPEPGVEILATGQTTWPDSLDVMGWNFVDHGMQVVFSTRIPQLVRQEARASIDGFLERQATSRAELDGYLIHPGGPRVLEAYRSALELDDRDLAGARDVLRERGNCSAVTVMLILERWLRAAPRRGETRLLTALGPGFSAGHVLLRA